MKARVKRACAVVWLSLQAAFATALDLSSIESAKRFLIAYLEYTNKNSSELLTLYS